MQTIFVKWHCRFQWPWKTFLGQSYLAILICSRMSRGCRFPPLHILVVLIPQTTPVLNLYHLCVQIKTIIKFPLTPMGVLALVSAQRDTPLSPPSTSAEIFRRTCLQSSLKKNLQNPGGGSKIFKKKFWSTFSPNQAILSTFRFFHLKKIKINCGHYVCLPSTKIVVTMFACHLHNSSGMCLHLARTNMS